MKKRIIALTMALATSMSIMIPNVYAVDTDTNIASSAKIGSVSHPEGGWYKSDSYDYATPLEGFIDGVDYSKPATLNQGLRIESPSAANGMYYPLYTDANPPMVYIDLGAPYDITKIELYGRSDTTVSLSNNTRLYLSNDPKIKESNWETKSELVSIHNFGSKGNQNANNGNNIAKKGKVTFNLSAESDSIAEWESILETNKDGNGTTKKENTLDFTIDKKDTDTKYQYVILTRGKAGITATDLTFGEIKIYADKESAFLAGNTNIAAKANNPDVKVTSASNPKGGKSHNNKNDTWSDVIPLDGLVDGTRISSSTNGILYLVNTTTNGNEYKSSTYEQNKEYTPVYDKTNPISVCVDLGKTYDISRIRLYGRSTAVSLSNNTRIYASNDAKAATSDWQNASDLYLIKDFGTGTSNVGNNIAAGGSVTFNFDGTEDDDSAWTTLSAARTEKNVELTRKSDKNDFRYIVIARGNATTGWVELGLGELEVYTPTTSLPEKESHSVKFTNLGEKDKLSAVAKTTSADTAMMFMAQYNADGRLLAVNEGTRKADTNEIVVDKIEKNAETKKVKLMLWDRATIAPLTDSKEKLYRDDAETTSIACWGDSLTVGVGGGGTRYPAVIADNLEGKDITVHNMGVGGEKANTIAGRMGAVPVVVNAFEIPASNTEKVEITFGYNDWFTEEHPFRPLLQSQSEYKGLNPCTINGVEGTITYEGDMSWVDGTSKYYFTRKESGETVSVPGDSGVITDASKTRNDTTAVFFVGQNGPSNIDFLVRIQKAMIEKLGTDKYIIVGLTTKSAAERADLEARMLKEYGEKYINMREYLSSYEAFEDAGIEPTTEDKSLISVGSFPKSFWNKENDNVHMNATGYTLVGNKLYEKLWELGYIN